MAVLGLEPKFPDCLCLNFHSVLGSLCWNWDRPGAAGWKEVVSQCLEVISLG